MHYDIYPVEWASSTRMAEKSRRAEHRRLVRLAQGKGHRYPRNLPLLVAAFIREQLTLDNLSDNRPAHHTAR